MTMIAGVSAATTAFSRAETAALVALAARRVAPLWPLASVIAVNPLAGYEHLPFDAAVAQAARCFGAREHLPISAWRRLLHAGRIDRAMLQRAAIAQLGGPEAAFALIGPDVSRIDLLMARLVDLPPCDTPAARGGLDAAAALIAKWCAAFFDQGQAACPMPGRDLGLYRGVLALIGHDREYHALTGAAGRRLWHGVPRDPLDAIAEALDAMHVAPGDAEAHLAAVVARLPGWAGHIRWRTDYAEPGEQAAAPAGMADLIALWLLLDRAQVRKARPAAAPPPCDADALAAHFGLTRAQCGDRWALVADVAAIPAATLARLFMLAAEQGWRDTLVPALCAARESAAAPGPHAQLVFCIDVRSEPFRRALEAQGAFETFGYAGFFGLPIARHRHGETHRQPLLPVLLAPQHTVPEAPAPRPELPRQAAAWLGHAKQGLGSAFATAEATGPLAGVVMAARTMAPRLVKAVAHHCAPVPDPAPVLDGDHAAFTLAEKVGYAALLFRMTGMSPATARLVVLVGHGGAAVNNPYASALDCGACGGQRGGFNARVMAAILNDRAVRRRLADEGLGLPDTTLFVAGEHNTTTDQVTLYDIDKVPPGHRADLDRLRAALDRAGAANRTRRAAQMGRTPDDLMTGSCHWGEVRPEWGLAGNAAFVVGPRWLTRAIDLDGRAFLHSYDWARDPDGAILAMILTAPMIVAQWINGQYLFSTIDNDRYGSGDKTTQNPVGRIGVVQGNGGDLCLGLPYQSLFADDGLPFHVPQRLLTVVHAPFDRVAAVVGAHDVLTRLFGGGWVHLVAIDPLTGAARRWANDAELAPLPSFPQQETQP